MSFIEIISKLKQSNNNLKGWESHIKLMPPHRENLSDREIKAKNYKKASVLILIYKKGGILYFPLLERHDYGGIHSGEIGLPGGKNEKKDTNYLETALRETEEEIGVNKNNIDTIFPLSQLYIPPSNFLVFPFVGFYNEPASFILDKREVKQLIEVSLLEFINQTKITNYTYTKNNSVFEVPAFSLNNKIIWGATAMILNEFKELIE